MPKIPREEVEELRRLLERVRRREATLAEVERLAEILRRHADTFEQEGETLKAAIARLALLGVLGELHALRDVVRRLEEVERDLSELAEREEDPLRRCIARLAAAIASLLLHRIRGS